MPPLKDIWFRFRQCLRMGTLAPLGRLAAFRWRLFSTKLRGSPVSPPGPFPTRPSKCPFPSSARLEETAAGTPLVSVIIPCYNYGAFVGEAVDSVLAQTLRDVDITVVDGGSTDGSTPDILSRLQRPRTRVLYQNRPTLAGENRNWGIAETKGRYICCLDADDRLKPTYLEKAVALLEDCRFDLVSAGYEVLGMPEKVLLNMPAPLLEDLVLGNHMLTCAVFSRALFEQTGGFTDTGSGPDHVAEDWRLWVQMAAFGARMRNIMEPLLEYRVHDTSLSRSPGVPPKWKQAKAISAALGEFLTPEAFARSRCRAAICVHRPR